MNIQKKNDKILKEFLEGVNKKKSWREVFINYKKIYEENRDIFGFKEELNNDATLRAINGSRSNNYS